MADHMFSMSDALRIAQKELSDHPEYGEFHAVLFAIIVEFADLYVQEIDPYDETPTEAHVLFPGLVENLKIRREERTACRSLL